MSVVAISSRPPHPTGPGRLPLARRRPVPTGSVLTVTVDVAMDTAPVTPELSRLVELIHELAAASGGQVRLAAGQPTAELPGATAPAGTGDSAAVGTDPETLRVLLASRRVRQGAREIRLTRIEFDLLVFLAENPRRVFTRLQLLSHVWGYEHAVARTVDVHVRRLRAKVGAETPLVTTVYGVGYRLADDARVIVDRHR